MKVICTPRNTGKTSWLIRLSAKNNIPIVCCEFKRVELIKVMAKRMNLVIPEPLNFFTLKERKAISN